VEVMLDIEVAGAIAPGAKFVVYFAPDATDQSFLNVMSAILNDTVNKADIVSISWGGPEDAATDQFRNEFDQLLQSAAHLGVTVCVAAGDNGSADFAADDPNWDGKAHVDFPASDPFVLACGGTQLTASGGAISKEVVWHDAANDGTGGGVSRVFATPSYQQNAGVPPAADPVGPVMRGVPDVAGDAAPGSGYRIVCDGTNFPDPAQGLPPVGGTSAVAPLWAGLTARLNQGLRQQGVNKPVGFLNPLLYAAPAKATFRDITQGNNGDYKAGGGWDACTGLGTPDGQKLLAALAS
jgi:kumamolisin